MNEMENQLRDSTDFMQTVSQELRVATETVVAIEKTLDDTVKQMGSMSDDAFFHMENSEFAKYVQNAVSAHKTWLRNLENMVKNRSIIPLQLDSSKCGFGHFYHSLTPNIPSVRPIWDALGNKHDRFHRFGAEIYSRELIADTNQMVQIAET